MKRWTGAICAMTLAVASTVPAMAADKAKLDERRIECIDGVGEVQPKRLFGD